MRIFKITPEIEVACSSEDTRYGFRHLATLFRKGKEIAKGKCCYYNRTWESYQFQSVLYNVVAQAEKQKVLTEQEIKICNEFIKGNHTDWSGFKMVGSVAKLGEIFCSDQKAKNDWKKRMIQAGLGNAGLQIPDDWDQLNEDEKEKRLNLVIKQLEETK